MALSPRLVRRRRQQPWLDGLKQLVEKKPIVILRFDDREWESLHNSRRGLNEFTVAIAHELLDEVRVPAPCLIIRNGDDAEDLYFGLISSRGPVTTLDTRIKVKRAMRIAPRSESGLLRLVREVPHAGNLKRRLHEKSPVVILSPMLSSYLIGRLASIDKNLGAMRVVAESVSTPRRFRSNSELQEDAVRSALLAFGLGPDAQALDLELVAGKETSLARVGVIEDSVIEHDARQIPGYILRKSDITGHAIFEHGVERLDVFTANRRPLERCFGVDLIYLNISRQNIVMLQYKMLEPLRREGEETDWIYRPDAKLDEEIRRMRKFGASHPPGPYEYRLNPAVFYLKFVKRDGSIANGGIITPLDHFEKLRNDPTCKGPNWGLRISYKSLDGRYLRQGPFLDLIRSGYIGAHAETTRNLMLLVEGVLKGDRAVVAAIQQPKAAV